MSTSAATPFRSFVQTPIFSVSLSSFSLSRYSSKQHHHHLIISVFQFRLCRIAVI